MNLANFVGGPSWCHRFMRRNKLSVRTRTTVCQKLPDDWEEKMTSFQDFVKRRKTELQIEGDKVFKVTRSGQKKCGKRDPSQFLIGHRC